MNGLNQTSPGALWAKSDIPTAKEFEGNWVVAIPNQVISFARDPEVVREEAARILGLPASEILVCAVATLESRVEIRW